MGGDFIGTKDRSGWHTVSYPLARSFWQNWTSVIAVCSLILVAQAGLAASEIGREVPHPAQSYKTIRLRVRQQHDLTDHTPAAQQFVILSGLTQR